MCASVVRPVCELGRNVLFEEERMEGCDGMWREGVVMVSAIVPFLMEIPFLGETARSVDQWLVNRREFNGGGTVFLRTQEKWHNSF